MHHAPKNLKKAARAGIIRGLAPSGMLTLVPAGRGAVIHREEGRLIRHELVLDTNYLAAPARKELREIDALNLALAHCAGIIVEAPNQKNPKAGVLHVPSPENMHSFIGPVREQSAAVEAIQMHFPKASRIEIVGGGSSRPGEIPVHVKDLKIMLERKGFKPIVRPEAVGGKLPNRILYLRKSESGHWLFDYDHRYVIDFFDWIKLRLKHSNLTKEQERMVIEREKKYLDAVARGEIEDVPYYV